MGCVVLFGAGASYGSGPVHPSPPPLGDQLFNELDKLGKTATGLPQFLKEKFRKNFEEGMSEFYDWSNQNTMSFQRELAGYLAKFKPEENNNYIRLLKKINTRRFTFVSLNYDLLFELSSLSIGKPISYSNTPNKNSTRLLKIHGSSNFWPDFGNLIFKNVNFSGNVFADVKAPIKILNQQEAVQRAIQDDSFAPAIAMYAEGKSVRVCPQFVASQQGMWKESLQSTSKIFIVGVRVHQADDHIWKAIAESKAQIHYFGFEKDEPDFIKWKQDHGLTNAYFHLSDFTDSVNRIYNLSR